MRRLVFVLLALGACSNGATAAPPPACDDTCKDGVALRSLRETMKLAYNLTLQGKAVGEHDETTPCPFGGTVRVFGNATANAVQGTTEVKLTYVLDQCSYLFKDDDPKGNYSMKLSGTVKQDGTLAVQPSSTSAATMSSPRVDFDGTVYDPPLPYTAQCPIDLGQSGNAITGRICDRIAGADL